MSVFSIRVRNSILAIRDRTFTTSIQILSRQSVSNGGGGMTTSWVVAATHLGRLRHSRQTDYLRLSGNEELPVGTWLVMLPVSAVVDTSQRVRAAGKTFAVVGTDSGRSDALVQTLFCLLAADAS